MHQHRFRTWLMGSLPAIAAAALLSAGCGGTSAFGLTADDNNPAKLQQAIALQQPREPGPVNATGKPLAFLVAGGKPQKLVAYDLDSKEELWRTEAQVSSRVVVGRDFIAHKGAGDELIARDVRTGKQLWKVSLPGEFIGAAADAERVYYTVKIGSGAKPVFRLVALRGGNGGELWHHDAAGQLGAPAARNGLVFSPFLRQWLAILDARSGEQITRIRGIDEEIAFARTTGDGVYFGSRAGVFYLDERAASGKRDESTYGSAALPKEFVRQHYHWDAFDAVQAGYSAYDRNRILWRARPDSEQLAFVDDVVVVHTYRFLFAFAASEGQLRWAYNHPREDLIASDHIGGVIGFVSTRGSIGAMDPKTGARVYDADVEDSGRLIGATFDAEGWAPAEDLGESAGTVEALASIARDRDARFNDVKSFAISAMASLPGADVTGDLITLIQNERTPAKLREKAVEVLVGRRDPAGLPHMIEALSIGHDYIEGTSPRAVGVVAQAIAALDPEALDAAQREGAWEALSRHLRAPQTPARDLAHVVRAIGTVGGGPAMAALRGFLLTYRADPEFGSQIEPVAAAIDVLLRRGGAGGRELVAFVAEDGRTQPSVAEYAQRALLQTEDD